SPPQIVVGRAGRRRGRKSSTALDIFRKVMSASSAVPGTTGGSRLGRPLLLFLSDELVLLGLHLLHELLEGGGRDDLVELGPVVGDEAHALDDDVVDEPLLAAPEHPVVDRDLGALLGDELGADDRTLALDGFADVLDLLTAVERDLPDVGALEEIREEADELVALGLAPWRPVPRQRALGGFGKVEDVVGDLANRPATILLASILLEFRVFEDFDRPVDLSAKLIDWRAGPGAIRAGQRDQQQGEERERTGEPSHRSNLLRLHLAEDIFRQQLREVYRCLDLTDLSVWSDDLVRAALDGPDVLLADQALRLDRGDRVFLELDVFLHSERDASLVVVETDRLDPPDLDARDLHGRAGLEPAHRREVGGHDIPATAQEPHQTHADRQAPEGDDPQPNQ